MESGDSSAITSCPADNIAHEHGESIPKRPRPTKEDNLNNDDTNALWSGSTKNRDVSTGPLAGPFAHSLAPLTRSLAPDSSLRSHPPLCSLVCSLAHFAHSLDWMSQNDLVLSHSAMVSETSRRSWRNDALGFL